MKKIEVEELKALQIEILKHVHSFCTEMGINYSLCFGTLIGAVRHKGYIPWDDDIDIMMQRKDYERFILEFSKTNSNLKILAPQITPNYYAPYANVIDIRTKMYEDHIIDSGEKGVKIDVFPIDFVPQAILKRKLLFSLTHIIIFLITLKNSKLSSQKTWWKKMLSKIARSLLSKVDLSRFTDKMARKISRHNNKSTVVNNLVWCVYGESSCFPSAIMNKYTNVRFEGEDFMSIIDYDTYLTCQYGDYMKLPPIEKRVTHHDFVAFWK